MQRPSEADTKGSAVLPSTPAPVPWAGTTTQQPRTTPLKAAHVLALQSFTFA